MSGPTSVAFDNKGLVQKTDPSQLAPGEFFQLENAASIQEGALSARTGHQSLTQVSLGSPITSLSKLNLGGADASNPRYRGSGTQIYRDTPPYAGNSSVYTGLTNSARWTAMQYNAGTAGTPALYFATRDAALRDNGVYSTLQKWGVDPPPIPVIATPNFTLIEYLTVPGGAAQRFIAGVNSNGGGFKTVSAMGAGPGYITITPTAGGTILGVNGIYVGMILAITDSSSALLDEQVIVLTVGATSFTCVTRFAHVAANVTLNWFQETQNTIFGTNLFYYNSFTLDASFNGTPDDGYSTDDPFHIALMSTDVTNVTQIEIRIVPNYSGAGGAATDYYSYKIVPAAVMTAAPVTPSPAWVELNIPKNSFTKVGNAGAGAFNWKNINEIDIIVTANASGAGQTVGNSSLYFTGGGGLNDSAAGTTPYSWLYVYRNPTNQAVGNPCVPMIDANTPPPITNGQVTLTLTGTAKAATVANGIGEISGPGSIKIYRKGGTFADGFYRHVGYATNPGAGATVTFVDNASDQSIAAADTLQFDNDPPVPSSLPTPLTASILAFQTQGGSGDTSQNTANTTARLVLSNLPTNFTASTIASVITVGSTLAVGFGVTSENAIISAVGYNTTSHATSAWVEVYLQYVHNTTATDPSETVECDTILRGNCDLLHQDFDCQFLAGDKNNPATLYQSKVGRPESFPVLNRENNFAQQINVGSPANPIYGITSIGPGELVCLNQDNIFIVQVWAGQMQQPIQAPASRGLFAKFCWCKGDNRIWYLAYDGIYTWAGGESQKVSNKIDYLFKKQTVNGLPPINFALASYFSFAYAQNSLYFSYVDTNNSYHRLRYEVLYDRWTLETIYSADQSVVYGITALFTEPDTGNFLVGVTDGAANSNMWLCDFYSTTDGWTTVTTDGIGIFYTAWRYWPVGDPTADYQIGEVIFELQNASDAITAQLFYNYATTATNTIAIPSGAVPARNRFWATVNSDENTAVQYSIGLKLTGTTGTTSTPVVFFTFAWRDYPWSDGGYPGPKVFSWLNVQANTSGVQVPFQLQIDGVDAFDFNVSGTFFNRASTITVPSNKIGYQYRVIPTQGYQGTMQLYGVEPQFQRQPMPITFWSSLGQVYGSNGFHIIYQIWLDYQCAVPVIFSIYVDGGVLFFQKTLPEQVVRGVQRFFLPAVNGSVFNKSKEYTVTLASQDGATQFQMYRDGSRLEIRNLSADQRGAFEQKIIYEIMPLES